MSFRSDTNAARRSFKVAWRYGAGITVKRRWLHNDGLGFKVGTSGAACKVQISDVFLTTMYWVVTNEKIQLWRSEWPLHVGFPLCEWQNGLYWYHHDRLFCFTTSFVPVQCYRYASTPFCLWRFLGKSKPGSATLKFFQKVSSSFPNWSTWSSVPPAMKKWPPWLKMVSAQSERKTTGYSMGICVGLLLDSRYMVWTFDILTGRALVKPRIVEWRFLQLWLSRLDLPHLAIFFSKGSDRPWWRV